MGDIGTEVPHARSTNLAVSGNVFDGQLKDALRTQTDLYGCTISDNQILSPAQYGMILVGDFISSAVRANTIRNFDRIGFGFGGISFKLTRTLSNSIVEQNFLENTNPVGLIGISLEATNISNTKAGDNRFVGAGITRPYALNAQSNNLVRMDSDWVQNVDPALIGYIIPDYQTVGSARTNWLPSTNWFTGPYAQGLNGAAFTNLAARAGGSASNATVGGVVWVDTGKYTNLNATGTLTNLGAITLGGHMLTNNGDVLRAVWAGQMANAAANTNQFQIVFGATTILDTGLVPASNCNWRAECTVFRTGSSAQHAEARLEWGPAGGVPFAFTNVNLELAEANGAANLLALKGASRRLGAHTNNSFRVFWEPDSR